jgi:hypothetical protein
MTKFSKLFEAMRSIAVIALVAVIGFSFVACDDGSGNGDNNNGGTPTTYSLDGIWDNYGMQITVSGNGSTCIFSAFGSGSLITNAVSKNYVKLGDPAWRNITSTGNLTWSGQVIGFNYDSASPNVATGTAWTNNGTFTMSSNGQTLTFNGVNPATGANYTSTYTRKQ